MHEEGWWKFQLSQKEREILATENIKMRAAEKEGGGGGMEVWRQVSSLAWKSFRFPRSAANAVDASFIFVLFLPCFILEWDGERPGKQGGKEIMISLISWQERNVNQRM